MDRYKLSPPSRAHGFIPLITSTPHITSVETKVALQHGNGSLIPEMLEKNSEWYTGDQRRQLDDLLQSIEELYTNGEEGHLITSGSEINNGVRKGRRNSVSESMSWLLGLSSPKGVEMQMENVFNTINSSTWLKMEHTWNSFASNSNETDSEGTNETMEQQTCDSLSLSSMESSLFSAHERPDSIGFPANYMSYLEKTDIVVGGKCISFQDCSQNLDSRDDSSNSEISSVQQLRHTTEETPHGIHPGIGYDTVTRKPSQSLQNASSASTGECRNIAGRYVSNSTMSNRCNASASHSYVDYRKRIKPRRLSSIFTDGYEHLSNGIDQSVEHRTISLKRRYTNAFHSPDDLVQFSLLYRSNHQCSTDLSAQDNSIFQPVYDPCGYLALFNDPYIFEPLY